MCEMRKKNWISVMQAQGGKALSYNVTVTYDLNKDCPHVQ